MKYIRTIISALALIAIAALIAYIILPLYDAEDAHEAMGKTYDFSENWRIHSERSATETVNLPHSIDSQKAGTITLANTLKSEYAGLAMTFYAENASIHVNIDGIPVFNAGFSEKARVTPSRMNSPSSTGDLPGDPGRDRPESDGAPPPPPSPQPGSEMGAQAGSEAEPQPGSEATAQAGNEAEPQPGSEPAAQTGNEAEPQNLLIPSATKKTSHEAGQVIVDIPTSFDRGIITIQLNQVDPTKNVKIHNISLARRDVKVISLMRNAVFPLLMSLLVFIASIVVIMLDIIRVVSERRTGGLAVIALLGLDCIIFNIAQTGLLNLFWGNDAFFEKIALICVVLMPPLIALYYHRIFSLTYRILSNVSLWLSLLVTAFTLIMEATGSNTLMKNGFVTIILLVTVIGISLYMVRGGQHAGDRHQAKWYDTTGLLCFTFSVFAAFSTNLVPESIAITYIKNIFNTLFFYLIMFNHIHIMLSEHKEELLKNEMVLREQVRLAEEAREEANMANEAKGMFLAHMSHEIRTPINAVLGMDEMILRESREKDIRNYAMDIYSAAQTLLSLINDILDLSKVESGKLEIIPVDYDICSMINDLVNMIYMKAVARDLDFIVKTDESIPSRLWGDDVRIRQVLTNILTNAVKYTESGSIWFRISGKREDDYEILHFEVEDTGSGIKEEDMPRLFSAFERIDEGRNRYIEGTGLGMSITIKLLSLMDSKLEVKSEYGKGSLFYFDLRQKIMDDTPVGDFESRIQNMSANYTHSRAFIAPEARVMVVDDNSVNRKVFSSLLKYTRMEITEAESGPQAIELAAASHYDMIFMDHMMPNMSGIEAMKKIRQQKDSPCHDTVIFVLTANAVAGAKEQYLSEGFDGFLSKPIISEKLENALRNNLPPEKVMDAPGHHDTDSDNTGRITVSDDLPLIDGLDWNVALLNLPDNDLLSSAIREFHAIIGLHADKLDEFYFGLSDSPEADEEALSSYRIQVHGMKSAAATIGIIPLAGMAKVLENAARDGDISVIRSLHSVFISLWRSYAEKLMEAPGVEDAAQTQGSVEAGRESILALLDMLDSYMEDLDIDGADETMNKLKSLKTDSDIAEKLEKLGTYVADLDADASAELTADIREML